MVLFYIIYALIFIIVALVGYAVMQIKLFGLNVKDFWSFIEANQILDKLYRFSKKYEKLSTQEQIIYLAEAEKYLLLLIRYLHLYGKRNTRNIQKCLINIKI